MIDFFFFLNSILLGFGLAMDAFSVSLANGLCEPQMTHRRMSLIAGIYSLFQYIMPVIGWICVHSLVTLLRSAVHFIPWIALALLLYLGGKMIMEGLRERKQGTAKTETRQLTGRLLLLQGIATSIDALSVGFTIAEYNLLMANLAALIIAIVTFAICFIGLAIGKRAGTKLSWKASMLGGFILIAIGIEIFVQGIV